VTVSKSDLADKSLLLADGGKLVFLNPRPENGDLDWLLRVDSCFHSDAYDQLKWGAATAPENADRARTVIAALVEESGGQTLVYSAGFAVALFEGEEARLRKLAVLPRYQRRGIGSALVRKMESYAQGRGFSALVPDSKRGDAACSFFKRLGWVGSIAPDGYFEFASPKGAYAALDLL